MSRTQTATPQQRGQAQAMQPIAMNQISKLTTANVADFLFSDAVKKQIALALPKHLKPERMIRMALTTVRRTPKLLECDPWTLVACIVQASELGLELSGPLGQAYIIPRKNKGKMEATFQIGYRGFLRLAYNTREVAFFNARAVHLGDYFLYSLGTEQSISHRCEAPAGAKITHFYSVLRQKDGAADCEVWSVQDMEYHRDQYRSDKFLKERDKSYLGPWDTEFEAMGCKTMIRELAKRAPLSAELMSVASRDEYTEFGLSPANSPGEFITPVAGEIQEPEEISDRQKADLNAAIVENEASFLLVRNFYKLDIGQQMLAADFDDCLRRIEAGEFSAPQEKGASNGSPKAESAPKPDSPPPAQGDKADEATKKAVLLAIFNLGLVSRTVTDERGLPPVHELTQAQAVALLAELEAMLQESGVG